MSQDMEEKQEFKESKKDLTQEMEEKQEVRESKEYLTQILVAVSESSRRGYPHPSKGSVEALEWTLDKIVRSNITGFKLQFLHFQPVSMEGHLGYSRGLQLLKYFENRCHDVGIATNSCIRIGVDVVKVICTEVERIQPNLLVLGSTRPGSRYSYTGKRLWNHNMDVTSVGEYCMQNVDCPIAIVKPSKNKKLL